MKKISEEAKYVISFINNTNRSIFLTGKAGTGKTTLLQEVMNSTHKNKVVVVPTGVAALNAKGVTIHSFFQIPPATFIPDSTESLPDGLSSRFENSFTLKHHLRMNNRRKQIFKDLELLIIDEISMVRADLLDAIDFILRYVRQNQEPFGGVQVLFIGDLFQLPPIVKNEEWNILQKYYLGIFFFHSKVIENNRPIYIELEKVFRQKDQNFISVLNHIRHNQLSNEDIELLNSLVKPGFDSARNPGYITLTTHNHTADTINNSAYEDINAIEYIYNADIVGDFPENIYPLEPTAKFKVGCQIIFVKNDLSGEKKYFNGKIGFVKHLSYDTITVGFSDTGEEIEVDRYEWQNIKYIIDAETKEIKEEILGTFTHYPIKLAWAITVHKSQGLTLEKVALDISKVFAPGQTYVALSRIRSLDKLVLLSPLKRFGIENSNAIVEYAAEKASKESLERQLQLEKKRFLMITLLDAYSWEHLMVLFNQHLDNYYDKKTRSKKEQFRAWAVEQSQKLTNCLITADKFKAQISKIFGNDSYDFKYIKERCDKAYDYFFPIMNDLVFQIHYTMLQVGSMKKMKTFFNEFAELESNFTKAVLKMHKAKLILEITERGGEILSKDCVVSPFMQNYRKDCLKSVVESLAANNILIDKKNLAEPKSKEPKSPKKPTIEVTLELFKEQHKIEEIAAMRKLTVGTIYTHLSKLIAKGDVDLSEIMPEDRIMELKKHFLRYPDASITEIKERADSAISWEELRLFRSFLSIQKNV